MSNLLALGRRRPVQRRRQRRQRRRQRRQRPHPSSSDGSARPTVLCSPKPSGRRRTVSGWRPCKVDSVQPVAVLARLGLDFHGDIKRNASWNRSANRVEKLQKKDPLDPVGECPTSTLEALDSSDVVKRATSSYVDRPSIPNATSTMPLDDDGGKGKVARRRPT